MAIPTQEKVYIKKALLCGCCGKRTFKPRRWCMGRHIHGFRMCCQDCTVTRIRFNWICNRCITNNVSTARVFIAGI